MKRKFRKMTAVLLSVVMVSLMIPIATVSVSAGQRDDIVNIAINEANTNGGYLGSSNKYNNWNGLSWCAYFVVWCARQAGIDSDIIPDNYSCSSIKRWYEDRGMWHYSAYYDGNYTPRAGDLVIYDWNYNPDDGDHIGIVTGISGGCINTVEGNTSGNGYSSGNLRYRESYLSLNDGQIIGYCSPNYYDEPEESFWVNVSGSQAYFYWNRDDNALYYDIKIWKNVLYDGDAYRKKWGVYSTNYAFALPKGTYQAYIDSVGDNYVRMSNVVTFTIGDVPTNLDVLVSGNQVYFDWNNDTNVSSYTLKVYKDFAWEGDSYETIWNIKDENYALALPEGRYQAYVDASSMSNVIDFYVGNTQPSLNANVFGNQVYFDWTCDNRANSYSLKIYKGHAWQSEIYENIRNITSTNAAVALPEGTYQAYIDASGDNYLQMGNVIEFIVSDSSPKLFAEVRGSQVYFSWSADSHAEQYALKIFRGHAWQSELYENITKITNTNAAVALPVGTYQAYIDASGQNYLQMGNVIEFSVSNSTPSLKAEVNGNNVSFEWTKDNQANEYSLKVFKNHAWQSDPFVSKWNIQSNSIDIKLPKGEYQAYIDASGDNYLQMGNVIDVVVQEDNYHSKILQEMVSMEYDETVFDGTEKIPNVVIMDNEYQLIEVYDYEAKYENNVHSGTALITITGKGDYSGEILLNFRIKNCVADTNLDDSIDIRDITAIQRHLTELEPFNEEQLAVADTNGDGEINIADATHLQMYLAEYDIQLG